MTRTDYEVIAAVLNETYFDEDRRVVNAVAYRFADRLALINPRFNREKFLRAAGVVAGT